jgi:hypothetical protein
VNISKFVGYILTAIVAALLLFAIILGAIRFYHDGKATYDNAIAWAFGKQTNSRSVTTSDVSTPDAPILDPLALSQSSNAMELEGQRLQKEAASKKVLAVGVARAIQQATNVASGGRQSIDEVSIAVFNQDISQVVPITVYVYENNDLFTSKDTYTTRLFDLAVTPGQSYEVQAKNLLTGALSERKSFLYSREMNRENKTRVDIRFR